VAIVQTDSGAQPEWSATPSCAGSTNDVPSLIDVVRGLGVTFGPSLLLDLFVLASTKTVVEAALGRQAPSRAARLFRPIAGLGVALTAVYLLAIQPRLRRWGTTGDEVSRRLPGDEFVPEPAIDATWAVTIDAPVDEVWPWLAQIGQDRGGFYSYAWLENLAGCKLRNADRIHPEWQQRTVGELMPLHPANGQRVARFEPGHALVLDGWGAFVVEPLDSQRTRLISRSRVPRGWVAAMYTLLLEIPHFIMQRKMLLGIKQRAEQARQRQRASTPLEPAQSRAELPIRSPAAGLSRIVAGPEPPDTDRQAVAAASGVSITPTATRAMPRRSGGRPSDCPGEVAEP
jgi:hypothetical protein